MDTDKIDQKIRELDQAKEHWAGLPLDRRIDYLRSVLKGIETAGARMAMAGVEAKGIPPDSSLVGEEFFAGPVVTARTVRLLLETLEAIRKTGAPKLPKDAVRTRPDGQVAVQVFPTGLTDKLLFAGFTAEVWQEPGVTADNLSENMAEFYRRERPPEGKVALVLAAGNVASIGPLDMVHKLFVEGQVVLCKFNPVNDYTGPFIEEMFADLMRDGFVRTEYGGADVGDYLCQHPDIDEIHITGSDKTHDIIVFGPGEEGAKRKAANQPRNTKRITSELGNVSPIIVMPGHWTQSELRFQAQNVATQLANNAGFNCNAARVIILHEGWTQKRAFLDMLRAIFAALPQRKAYYPGADRKYAQFVQDHPQAQPVGPRSEGILPWTIIPDVPATEEQATAFKEEAWCSIVAQTTLPGADAGEFLRNAVEFCNETVWGTLNACIIIHPKTREKVGEAALERAIGDLRYGSVAVNHWPGLCYGFGCTTWGAYPGHTLDDIQSGIGTVHNTYLFDRPQKTVLQGPFTVFPKPPWFVTHKRSDKVARKMLDFETGPSMAKIPGIAIQAILG